MKVVQIPVSVANKLIRLLEELPLRVSLNIYRELEKEIKEVEIPDKEKTEEKEIYKGEING